jgi:hypothetical protein
VKLVDWTLAALVLASAATPAFAQWPLGTFTPTTASDPQSPPGYTCSGFRIDGCPNVATPARGFIAVAMNVGAPRGLVMFFTGGDGDGWWTLQYGANGTALTEELRALGFVVVQVRWQDAWLVSSPGNDAGTAHLGCRPATVIRHVHDTLYAPLGVNPPIGEAGFCVTGNSGGSSQIGYALSHYGLDTIIDVAIPTGGPPHASLAKAMMDDPAESAYWYPLETRQFIDEGFGFFNGNGPGALHDPTFVPRWLEESHSTGGNDYLHPSTRIHFITGAQDPQMLVEGGDWFVRLQDEGSPMVTREVVPNTPHGVAQTAAGRAAIRAAILEAPRAVTGFCFGDGSGAACPCGNTGATGSGCSHSQGSSGLLATSGLARVSADTLVLVGTHMTATSSALYVQGTLDQNGGLGAAFGDGLRCIGGAQIRLGTKTNVGGSSQYPVGAEPHVSVRGVVPPGATRFYTLYFRDPAAFCTSATFNFTNGVSIVWAP